jgi:hypothetical protein
LEAAFSKARKPARPFGFFIIGFAPSIAKGSLDRKDCSFNNAFSRAMQQLQTIA